MDLPELAELNKQNNPHLRVLPSGFHAINLRQMMSVADKHNFGVVAINQRNKYIMRATLEAAWKTKSPVILEIAESETSYCNMLPERLSDFAHEIIQEMIDKYGYSVPVGLHHDHVQKDTEGCTQRSIEAGFTSILIDLSKLSLEGNIAGCQEIAKKIYPLGVDLEVEEGVVHSVGSEEAEKVAADVENYYSKVDDMHKLMAETGGTGASCFIGNQHGIYKEENPRIGYDRLKEIADSIRPLGAYPVMHGGSGLKPEQFQILVNNGARKINYATSIQNIFFKHTPQELLDRMDAKGEEMGRPRRKVYMLFEEEFDQLDHTAAVEEMTDHIAMMMTEAFNSADKAQYYVEMLDFLNL
ncbi:class II fructose-bisphosphate aldolase [Candidatus Peregrinibacteria bacterium]|jgi:ketose-bisphosphate aldolase|nr:class II fructose-bisphosphate aldolase [Candidatus Peregrinibacteria bacterium]MBT7483887.1 class II fructose-bisphosphate aldolase [Candidatus Peregrinibacteria bacterium]MBT7702678.1 class II fructose-bisphosphate aldolase [Candidatus Peregrinibacteria bacterium]